MGCPVGSRDRLITDGCIIIIVCMIESRVFFFYSSSTDWDQLFSEQYLEILTEPEYTCGYSAILKTLNGKPGYFSATRSALRWSRDLIH